MALPAHQKRTKKRILNDTHVQILFRGVFAFLLALSQGTFAIWYPTFEGSPHKAGKGLNRVQDFVGWVRQLVAGNGSLKTVTVRPPDPVGEGATVPDWAAARLEREWTEKFLNGEITLPVLPYSFNSPTRPAPRNRAERRTAARGQLR